MFSGCFGDPDHLDLEPKTYSEQTGSRWGITHKSISSYYSLCDYPLNQLAHMSDYFFHDTRSVILHPPSVFSCRGCLPCASHPLSLNNNIDVGANILYFQCFVTTVCFCFVNPNLLAGIAAFVEILLLAVSKHVLKRFQKSWIFRPRLAFFMSFCPRRATKLRSL